MILDRLRQFRPAQPPKKLRILFDRYCATQQFAPHPMMGPLSRTERMRWAYLHMNHHLRQFGV